MLKKIKSDNLFSMESHEETAGTDVPEQGTVTEVEEEAVVAEVTPSDDVEEAGDDIGQATPNAEIEATPDADLTVTETTVDSPDGSETEEVSKLTQEGEEAANVKDEIVATATAELTGEAGGETDINGNAITEEQAAENAEEETIDEEVDEEAEQTAADKDITEQVDDVTENVDEELGDAIGEDSTDGGIDGEATDDTSTDIDSGGDQGDLGMDADTGGIEDPEGGDDAAFDDDTPLEGAEDVGSTTDTDVDATGGDVGTDELGEGDTSTDIESNDGGELASDDTVEDTSGVEGDTDVADDVATQNEAADVTAEAASSDADQTDFIAGDTPEQHGEEPSTDELPANDGEEVVAEATPAVQNETDVGAANANNDVTETTADEVDFEDETPLDGAEEAQAVDVDESLTPPEVDGEGGNAATVEESQTDQIAAAMDEAAANPDPAEEGVMAEDGETEVETEVESSTDGAEAEVVESETDDTGESETVGDISAAGEPGIDAEAGEIEDNGEEADLEEGELDIPDVDDETTEEEVEEAETDADEMEAEADAEEAEGDIADKTIEELQKEKESLEKFCIMLQWGIANESYNPGMLAFMHAETNRIRETLVGIGMRPKVVALESFDVRDMDLAYQATLESFSDMTGRISKINSALRKNVERWWAKSLVDKVKTRTTALNKQADLLLTQVKASDKSTHDVSGVGAYLAHADGSLVKSVADDLKTVTAIGGRGFKATEGLQKTLVSALNEITGAKTPGAVSEHVKRVVDLKDIKADFPDAAFRDGMLGGFKLELKDAASGDTLKDRILNMGRRSVPVVVKSGKGSSRTFKLSKGDVTTLLTMAKAYTALADKLASTTGDRAVDNVSKIRAARDGASAASVKGNVEGGDYAGADATAHALEMVSKSHNDLYKFVTKHCIDVADALCGVAKRFVK